MCAMAEQSENPEADNPLINSFRWTTSAPVVRPNPSPGDDWISIKDPSIVRYKERWHLFCTVRGIKRSHAIVYLSFQEWDQAVHATQYVLSCHEGHFAAPQVLYFIPHKKWYLICQATDESWTPKYQAAYSTTSDISDPHSWSRLKPLGAKPADGKTGLDFWIICDNLKAHLFFTTLDGCMWREETLLADFPAGWSTPGLAIKGDIFEAGHTYFLGGTKGYLTLVEAQNGRGWRYYKAYAADRLDGSWQALAAGKDNAFASMQNVTHTSERWTDVVSHGELLRTGCDENLEVDPKHLRMLFQGVLDKDRSGKKYGEIPWQLGILEPVEGTKNQPSAPADSDKSRH
jgi:hypothetical protein